MKIMDNYLEKTYAGWLGKIIGIRLGAAIEGWTYDRIKDVYGELYDYPVDFKDFAADDDSNGPLFFLRALEDSKNGYDITPQDVGEALLNYAPFEHGFFWWGGYGVSTEHTAYLNLRNGIKAPRSGSIEQNGEMVAEQIGGQIFIDTWGLVSPGNPEQASKYAKIAASVTHDGNGIYGGIFIACAISIAYVENDINTIIEKALSYIPTDCEYTIVVRAVMDYYKENPNNWRDCYKYIYENFGYDKYPGNCHIIPNTAVVILSLLYGKGDFSDTINICNMCGWDTDCNVANVGTIMGVRGGLECIDYEKWRAPINDFLACSSVIGSLNIMDIPYGVSYIAKLAYDIAGQEIPQPMKDIIENRIDSCHFEYEGSTHAIRARVLAKENNNRKPEVLIKNSNEIANTGKRSLKTVVKNVEIGEKIYLYKKTYYTPDDFHDSRYDPCFSPIAYTGQTIYGSAYIPDYCAEDCYVQLYAHESRTNTVLAGDRIRLSAGNWVNIDYQIPFVEGALIDEIGFLYTTTNQGEFICFIDDLYVGGEPNYILDASKETEEVWNFLHKEISQFTKLKGLFYLEDNQIHLSCSDFAEAYTGAYNWKNYSAEFTFTPVIGEYHYMNFRVQGAIRSYAVGFYGNGKFALLKNDNGYKVLEKIYYEWNLGEEYTVKVEVDNNKIEVYIENDLVIQYTDEKYPYLEGAVGISVENGSHCKLSKIKVK